MNLNTVSGDILVLIFYIVLTIMLILFGKLVGKTLYSWYWNIDPNAYKSYLSKDICKLDNGVEKCFPRDEEEIRKDALERAEEDGRWVGAWIGFLIGGVLSIFKAYNIYVKLKNSE